MGIDALIPARGGTKRIPGKNMKLLNGMPLVYWTIKAAKEAGIFDRVVVSTEDAETKEFCEQYCDVVDRSPEYATDTSPDVFWILQYYITQTKTADFFMTLRPTSPFRTANMIRAAWNVFSSTKPDPDSLRSISLVRQHPGKMWFKEVESNIHAIYPIIRDYKISYHDSFNLPTQRLFECYVQNGCIEIGKKDNVLEKLSVSGKNIRPLCHNGPEAHDINTPEDWVIAEWYLKEGMVTL